MNMATIQCATCPNGTTRKASLPCGACRKKSAASRSSSTSTRSRGVGAVAILAIIAALSSPARVTAAINPRLFTRADLVRSLQTEDGHLFDYHDEHHAHDEDGHEHETTSLQEEHEHGDHEHDHDHHEEDEGDDHDHESHSTKASDDLPKPWFYTILATVLVNVTSLSGLLLLLIPVIHRGYLQMKGYHDAQDSSPKNRRLFDICIPAFAVGALMSTAMFLVFPEALHLIEGAHSGEGHDDHAGHDDHRSLEGDEHAGHNDSSESANAAKFGCAVLGGFLLPIALGLVFSHHHCNDADAEDAAAVADSSVIEKDGKASVVTGNDEGCDCCADEQEQEDVETGVAVREIVQVEGLESNEGSSKSLAQMTPVNWRLVTSVLVGDAFCNFVDGIFIGAAFLGCSWGTVFSIILVTLLHEIPQEIADFLILTRYAGLSTAKACFVNFFSGLSVTLGGIVVLATNTSDEATGIILAMAGGAYINISVAETVPRIDSHIAGKIDRLFMLTFFIIGCVPIGLVLLKHEHC